MLRKKYNVQKSFRIDHQLSDDLEYLSNVLERPQNDLVNIAIESLIFDNRQWFIGQILINQCSTFFENDKSTELIIDNLQILIQIEGDIVRVVYCVYNKFGKFKFNDEIEIYYGNQNDAKKEIKEILMKIAQYIEVEGETISKLLRERLNYK